MDKYGDLSGSGGFWKDRLLRFIFFEIPHHKFHVNSRSGCGVEQDAFSVLLV